MLDTIKDDATADAALPKLEAEVERHNALSKKLDSYKVSMDEWGKLMKDNGGESLNSVVALMGKAIGVSIRVPNRGTKITAVLGKLDKSNKDSTK